MTENQRRTALEDFSEFVKGRLYRNSDSESSAIFIPGWYIQEHITLGPTLHAHNLTQNTPCSFWFYWLEDYTPISPRDLTSDEAHSLALLEQRQQTNQLEQTQPDDTREDPNQDSDPSWRYSRNH